MAMTMDATPAKARHRRKGPKDRLDPAKRILL
jgi:hypothetical protein